jgi:hypothetical protein
MLLQTIPKWYINLADWLAGRLHPRYPDLGWPETGIFGIWVDAAKEPQNNLFYI